MTDPAQEYTSKNDRYFSGLRDDILRDLEKRKVRGRILEIGCGDGTLGSAVLERGLADEYVGIELVECAAIAARSRISQVITGDIETIEIPFENGYFDVLIASEVLEHLRNPHDLLRDLGKLVRTGGLVYASSPNVCHYEVIWMLMRGDFNREDFGVMDRTHLRWFTPKTFAEMFREAGFTILSVGPVAQPGRKANLAMSVLPKWLHRHLWRQINLCGVKQAKGPAESVAV